MIIAFLIRLIVAALALWLIYPETGLRTVSILGLAYAVWELLRYEKQALEYERHKRP